MAALLLLALFIPPLQIDFLIGRALPKISIAMLRKVTQRYLALLIIQYHLLKHQEPLLLISTASSSVAQAFAVALR